MEWNNGKERALFEKEQAKLRKEYLAADMTEEQIQKLRSYDEDWYKNRRREALHTQRLNITAFDEDDGDEDTQNPLLKKFLHNFSVEDKYFESERFGWIEEIEDEQLYKAISSLSDKDKEILTFLIIDGFNITQASKQIGVSHQAISKKVKKFQKIFGKGLRKRLLTWLPLEGD